MKTLFLRHNEPMFAVSHVISFLKNNLLQLITLFVLALSLAFTWSFFQSKNKFPEGTHIAIQNEFQQIVRKKILDRNPLARNIQFDSIWTETTGESSQIRAVFNYSFKDPKNDNTVEIKVRGSALINKQDKKLKNDVERWSVGEFEVDHTEINFNNEMIVISPRNN